MTRVYVNISLIVVDEKFTGKRGTMTRVNVNISWIVVDEKFTGKRGQ